MAQMQAQYSAVPADASVPSAPPTVIVIGAGVVGLSCAIKLQAKLAAHDHLRDTEIVIVAREWPDSVVGGASTHSVDYASMWAGAHVRPLPAATAQLRREAAWLRHTVAEFDRQVDAEPWCGITRTAAAHFFDEPGEYYQPVDLDKLERDSALRGWRVLPPSEVPSGVKLGLEHQTFCIHAPMYCEHLLRKFTLAGGKTARRELKSEAEAYTLVERPVLVVNASGMGFGDRKCFPTRGQTVLTSMAATRVATREHSDGSYSFLIPRFFNGGTIVGGTKEPHDWRSEPDPSTRSRLLAAGRALEPYAQSTGRAFRVVADVVGRRPTRDGGVVLDVVGPDGASWDPARGGSRQPVIRAYGAGGRGFEMSWGMAEEVAGLAMGLL